MSVWMTPVEISYTDSGAPGVNTWHWRIDDLATDPEGAKQDNVDLIHEFYHGLNQSLSGGVGIFAGGTVFTMGESRRLDEEESQTFDWDDITAAAGEGDMPASQQICVSWRTSLSARRGRGRTFLGPLDTRAMGADGRLTSEAADLVNLAAANLVDSSTAIDGGSIGIWGLETSGTGPAGAKVLRDVTGHSLRNVFAVLRSRRD